MPQTPHTISADEPDLDLNVRAVQSWLNSTYSSAPGWIEVPTTGRTGWSTVYGLTRALQVELGITALSNNFGEGTLAALAAKFPALSSSTSATPGADRIKLRNVVRIIQGGLYCKGYNPSGFDGDFGVGMTTAIGSLKDDMGFGPSANGTVTPKIFKGLLTMDAYRLLAGGTSGARTVQQWLNSKYIGRKNFFVMPCDGLYSRNTQQSLCYAIQYELGMSDATANGNFGPGTRTGLQQKGGFAVGATDTTTSFVRLFTAALIFNRYEVRFDPTFTASDSATVSSFQAFCKLDVTGVADYRTWCSLLVSNGDPTRPGTACDTRMQLTTTTAPLLRSLGYTTVGRYLTRARVVNALEKDIKAGELEKIFAAGLSVFPIYQENGSTSSNFSYVAGVDAGYRADSAARRHGIPAGTTIYFSVDYDATDADISAAVLPHFRGLRDALVRRGDRYSVGTYGTRNVCQSTADADLSKHSFVAGMSTGYSGNLGYPLPTNWAFDQIFEYTPSTNLPLDKNIVSGRDSGFSSTTTVAAPQNADLLEYLLWLEVKAQQYIETSTNRMRSAAILVCQMMRKDDYRGVSWDAVAGPVDEAWIQFAEARIQEAGISPAKKYIDKMSTGPAELVSFSAAHLFYSIEAYLYKGYADQSDHVYEADIAGWAGDLLSVLNGYVGQSDSKSLGDYASSSIGKAGIKGNKFDFEDICQDIDAYNIAHEHHMNPGQSFAECAVRHVTIGGPSPTRNRFLAFREDRFGSEERMLYAARQALHQTLVPAEPMYIALSITLLATLQPRTAIGLHPGEMLELTAQSFADRIVELS